MPIKPYNTKAEFDEDYDSYTREAQFPVHLRHAEKYVEILKLKPIDKIAIIGCGFGWTVEALELMGFQSVAGVDKSNYILSELAKDPGIYQGTADISDSLGLFKPDIIITEYLLDCYYDSEIPDLLKQYDYAKIAAHLVINKHDCPERTDLNIKYIEDWKALLPKHIFISGGNYRWL